jgi:hypothetical protein
MQWVFLIIAILGTLVPLAYVGPFLITNGPDIPLLVRQLFVNNISATFGIDVMISALALFVFVFLEGRRRGMKHLWAYLVCTLLFGVSSGFPLFLFFRERKMHEA